MLGSSDHWYVDGTFFVVPNGFYQLINIAIFDHLSGIYLPLFWALATHKTYDIYVNLFWDLAKLLPKFKKVRITVDFEQKLSEALSYVFDCEICGCYYHFSQCMQKKAQKLGILSKKNEKETQGLIQTLKSLCFNNNKIRGELQKIKKSYDTLCTSEKESELIDYYQSLIFFWFYCLPSIRNQGIRGGSLSLC